MTEPFVSKKYLILAKRHDDTHWSIWTDTNDINRAIEHADKVRSLGYEAQISDARVTTMCRSKLKQIHDHIKADITKYETKRDENPDVRDSMFYVVYNTKINTLNEIKTYVEKILEKVVE